MLNTATAVLTSQQMQQLHHHALSPPEANHAMAVEGMGQFVAQAIQKRWTPRPVLVLCGPGGNGADGFATAQCLAASGWSVRVAQHVPPSTLPRKIEPHNTAWQGHIEEISPAVLQDAKLVVDAIFGTGFNRPLDAKVATTLTSTAEKKIPIVAIDVPSGLFCNTGTSTLDVCCNLTIACNYKKPAHLLQPGRALCGELLVARTGIGTQEIPHHIPVNTFENHPILWVDKLPILQPEGHKYTRGHALIWGGWPMTGAARLAAMAAARTGAGLTTIAVPEASFSVYAAALTSIMVAPIKGPQDLLALLCDPRYTGLLIGPGAGLGSVTRSNVLSMLATGRPTVLDADALSCFQDDPLTLFSSICGPCVLTPHEGEFKKLFHSLLDTSDDKLTRARSAARISQCTVILKGSDTVIAAPNGDAIINTNAPPTLATAGSGDVLAGIVLGLLTQGMPPFLACAAAVWLHGAAAASYGLGLIAEDLPHLLPAVLQKLQMEHPKITECS